MVYCGHPVVKKPVFERHGSTHRELARSAGQPKKRRHFLAKLITVDHAMGELRTGLHAQSAAKNTLL